MTDSAANEPQAPTQAEPTPAPALPPVVAGKPARRGWGGPVLGGVIAAGLGFGLAQYGPVKDLLASNSATVSAEDLGALQAEVDALKAALAEKAPAADLVARLDAVEARVAEPAVAVDLAPLEARLSALEQRPVGSLSSSDAASLAALKAQMETLQQGGIAQADVDAASAALQAKLDEAMASANALQASSAETAAKAAHQSALLQIAAALDTGAPFGAALAALDPATTPEILTQNAAQGLPSLPALRASFPDAARLALDAALKADLGASWSERVTNFLRTQTGARSIAPREGDDPDAILSRAEAALTAGNLTAALAELDSLPDTAKGALSSWRAQADLHVAAAEALSVLQQKAGQ